MTDMAITSMYGPGYMPYNNYMNQVTMMNLYDDMGMMGMNGGLLNFSPGFTGMNYDSYFDQMMKYQDFMHQYQHQTVINRRNNEVAINGPMEAIQGKAAVLNEKIVANEQEYIMSAWQSYLNAVQVAYPEADEATLIARAKSHYQQIYGTSLNDDIRKYGNSSFKQGLFQMLSFGLANRKSAEENISDLTGEPLPRSQNIRKNAGRAVGGALYGAGAGFIFGGPLGALIGAGIGAVVGVVTGIIKNRN